MPALSPEERRAIAEGHLSTDLTEAFELMDWGRQLGGVDVSKMSDEDYAVYEDNMTRGFEAQKLLDKITWLRGNRLASQVELDSFRSRLWENEPDVADKLFGENQTVEEVLRTFDAAQAAYQNKGEGTDE